MSDETYNGWKNYPTWVVKLWLDNDQSLHNETMARTLGAIVAAEEAPQVTDGIWTREQAERLLLADNLKDWVTETILPSLDPRVTACHPDGPSNEVSCGLANDLLGFATDHVDWNEIAASCLEQYADVSTSTR